MLPINRDTSVSKSGQLDIAVSVSKIASLSSGAFVGMIANDPLEKIKLKTFHSEILNAHEALKREQSSYHDLPVIKRIIVEMAVKIISKSNRK